MKNKLINSITEFMDYVHLTDRLFKEKYNLEISPIVAAKSKKIIPLKGILMFDGKEINYQFHGLGCCFVFNENTIIDFDWDFGGINFYHFWVFVKKSIPKYEDKDIHKER